MRTIAVLAAALVTIVACTSSRSAPATAQDVTPRLGSICSADGWCWYDPIPQGRDLRAIWGSGPGDFWVAGAEGTLLHWNGNAWTLAPPVTTATMLGLWGASAEDVWASGVDGMLHWNGASWSAAPVELRGYGEVHLSGIWGSGSNDVWTVGTWRWGGRCPPCESNDAAVQHWDGARWAAVPLVATRQGTAGSTLSRVWGSGRDDVWAVGAALDLVGPVNPLATNPFGSIFHWDGSAWMSAWRSSTAGTCTAVWGSGPTDVWVAITGVREAPGIAATDSSVLHWDGASWTTVWTAGSALGLLDVWGSGPADVWVFTDRGTLVHWDGVAWTTTAAADAGAVDEFRRAWASGPRDVWAVGSRGTTAHWDGATWTPASSSLTSGLLELSSVSGSGPDDVWAVSRGPLLHWDGAAWASVSIGIPGFEAEAVWVSGPRDVWLVGYGTIVHGDGTAWTISWQDPSMSAHAIWGSGPRDVWAVGFRTILHWDGTAWARDPVDVAGVALGAVWGSGANDVWAVGDAVLHWDGTSWTRDTSLEWSTLTTVWSSGPEDVWLASSDTSVWHWDGIGWTPRSPASWIQVQGLWGTGPEDVWAVGTGVDASLLHWDGHVWTPAGFDGRTPTLRAVWGSGPDDVWTVGSGGAILRHHPPG